MPLASSKPMALAVPAFLQQMQRQFNRCPWPVTLLLGGLLGVTIGLIGFSYLHEPAWALAWISLFASLAWLGYRLEPISLPKPKAVLSQPRWVREGPEDHPLSMMELPAGTFLMGSPDEDDMADESEKPQHLVKVSAFRIMRTPVTVALYSYVMRTDGDNDTAEEQAQLPMTDINWEQAVKLCNRLSEKTGYTPCYYQRFGRWRCNWRANGYRLPTEAEWEYACRAGTQTRYSFGDDPAQLDRYAWLTDNSSSQLQSVAQKLPNPWGLYDMHGNVWEWCWDYYGDYSTKQRNNPTAPRKGNYRRVLRGGSFDYPPTSLRSASRDWFHPKGWHLRNGFRCVRVPPQP